MRRNRLRCLCTVPIAVVAVAPSALAGGWVTYTDETSVRLNAAAALVSTDNQEKDYAVGDVDHDNDDDLIVVRKQPFTTTGGRRNVLLMNVDGVLTDQTDTYLPEFADFTNDRDIILVDVDNDGWDDIVTAAACNDCNAGQVTSESRLYLNLGDGGGPDWLGFGAPVVLFRGTNFCHVAAGDVNGDGYADLHFVSYRDTTASPQSNLPACDPAGSVDTEDQLMINGGAADPGCFSLDNTRLDDFCTNCGPLQLLMRESNFGTATTIADMNGDSTNDIVKSQNGPVWILNNDAGNEGFFDLLDPTYQSAAYHVSVGDLNNDDKLDLVVSDDGTDRALINTGNGGDGMADFTTVALPELPFGQGGGFGSDSYVVDLDGDTWKDVIICDVDVDAPGCTRISHIYRNNGGLSFTLDKANLPDADLTGVHDIAVIDVNSDTFPDLVVGRCSGTQVWINSPPITLEFTYPAGLPQLVAPDETTDLDVDLAPEGDTIVAGTETLHVSVKGGVFVPTPLVHNGGTSYTATLPAGQCTDQIEYYFTAQVTAGLTFADPSAAPGTVYKSIAAAGTNRLFEDHFETDVSGWTIVNDPSLTGGGWEQAVPIGTFFVGELAAPNEDVTPANGTKAFVTENSAVLAEPYGLHDVDGGPTRLISPVFDLAANDAFISYWRWMFHDGIGEHDVLAIEVSADAGANWTEVESVTSTDHAWEQATFLVSDYVTPTDQVRVRFTACDCPQDSGTEAGIDAFVVDVLSCTPCTYDLDGDGVVTVTDLLQLLGQWGQDPGGPPDFDGDGMVGVIDLLGLLGAWGSC